MRSGTPEGDAAPRADVRHPAGDDRRHGRERPGGAARGTREGARRPERRRWASSASASAPARCCARSATIRTCSPPASPCIRRSARPTTTTLRTSRSTAYDGYLYVGFGAEDKMQSADDNKAVHRRDQRDERRPRARRRSTRAPTTASPSPVARTTRPLPTAPTRRRWRSSGRPSPDGSRDGAGHQDAG